MIMVLYDDFNTRNKVLTAKHSDKDIDIIKFVRRFQNFIGGINVGLKRLLWKAFQNLNFMGT